jgi:hypothetical protein
MARAVRPVADDWGLDEQATNALVDVLVALSRKGYNLDALSDMLVQIELNLNDPEGAP